MVEPGPQYYSISEWTEAPENAQQLVLSALCRHIHRTFEKGMHGFESVTELFESLKIEHTQCPAVRIQNLSGGRLLKAEFQQDFPAFKMSRRSLGRLVHRLESVRLQRNPWYLVDREGLKRLVLIVQ